MTDPEAARKAGQLKTGYGAVAAEMWMIYDTLLNFDNEIQFIWRRPNSWVKWVYAFVRYVPLLNGGGVLALSADKTYPASGCRTWIIDQLVVMEVLTIVVEAILVMRLYALYNQNKAMLIVILVAFLAEITLMIVTLGIVIPNQTFSPSCLAEKSPGIYMMFWLSSLVFETFLFVLTLFKFFRNVKRAYKEQSILYVFIRDGTWAFAVIFCAMLLNTLMYRLIHTPLAGMGYFWALSVMSFSGSHILLNMRRLMAPADISTLPTTIFTSVAENCTEFSDLNSQTDSSFSDSCHIAQTSPAHGTSIIGPLPTILEEIS